MKKKENKIKKTYSKDNFTVILEDIYSNNKLVLESVSGLKDIVISNHKEFLEFKKETKDNFKAVAGAFTEMNDKMDNMQGDINNLQEDVKVIKGDISNLQEDVKVIKGDVSNIQGDVIEIKHKLSEKVDLKDFQTLEKRFVKLEKLVFAKLAH